MKYFKYFLFCFTIVCLFSVVAYGYDSYVKVFSISGKAEVRTGDEDKWIEAQTGMTLHSGDGIKTYKDSYIDLAFDRGKKNAVRINSNTHVVLKLGKEEKMELIDGEVFSTINDLPRGSSFMLRTPTAVCGARGTDWLTKADKEKTVVEAYKDNVFARGIDKMGRPMEGREIIKHGFKSKIVRFKKPSKPTKIPEKDLKHGKSLRKSLSKQGAAKIRKIKTGKKRKTFQRLTGQAERAVKTGEKPKETLTNRATLQKSRQKAAIRNLIRETTSQSTSGKD